MSLISVPPDGPESPKWPESQSPGAINDHMRALQGAARNSWPESAVLAPQFKIEWTENSYKRWGLYVKSGTDWKPVKFCDHFCQAHDEMMLMRKVHLFDAEGKPVT